MGVLEDVFVKAKCAADYAGKKTGEIVEISKLRINAAELQSKISKQYEELGILVYNASKSSSDCTEDVHIKSEAIEDFYAQLAKVNEKIDELRKLKKCPGCDFGNSEDAAFCQKCGKKL